MAQCTARSKGSGQQCKNQAVKGKRVCRIHGGLSLAGPASPRWKTGRYSKYLPARLAERYHEALSDPDLLALRSDIAMAEARVADLLMDLNVSSGGEVWRSLAAAQNAFDKAERAQDTNGMRDSLATLRGLIKTGAQDYERWEEVGKWLERKRRLTETEQKRLVAMQQMLTVEQTMTLVSQLVEIVNTHVEDKRARVEIATRITQLVAVPGDAESSGGDSTS